MSAMVAGDDMEIASEHGHHASTEDIDIDIDFVGQPDDDYMLEDVRSTEEVYDYQPEAMTDNNDDPMDDDDNLSYQMDEDVLQAHEDESMDQDLTVDMPALEGEQDDKHGDETMLSEDTMLGLGQSLGNDAGIMASNFENVNDEASTDLSIDQPTEIQHHDQKAKQNHEDFTSNEANSATEPVDHKSDDHDSEEQIDGLDNNLQRSEIVGAVSSESHEGPPVTNLQATSPESSPYASTVKDDADRRLSSCHSPEGSKNDLSTVNLTEDLEAESVHRQAAHGSDSVSNLEATVDVSLTSDVVIIYQSVEYALFAKSDTEDPDSYFLNDKSFLEKPIADLFAALRKVVMEDLSDEDELCIAVEDLGLETDENSAGIQDVTLLQLVELRETLLENDDVKSPGPLVAVLGTRKNFMSRLAILTAGAADGQGLSEFQAWDEAVNSEYQGEASEYESGEFDEETQTENQNQETEAKDENAEPNQSSNEVLPNIKEEPAVPTDSMQYPSGNGQPTSSTTTIEVAPDHVEESPYTVQKVSEADTIEQLDPETANDNDDGDLIDYEDEEEPESEQSSTGQKSPSAATISGTNDTTEIPETNGHEFQQSLDEEVVDGHNAEQQIQAISLTKANHSEANHSHVYDGAYDEAAENYDEGGEDEHNADNSEKEHGEESLLSNYDEAEKHDGNEQLVSEHFEEREETEGNQDVEKNSQKEIREGEVVHSHQYLNEADTQHAGHYSSHADTYTQEAYSEVVHATVQEGSEEAPNIEPSKSVDVAEFESATANSSTTMEAVDEINYDEAEVEVEVQVGVTAGDDEATTFDIFADVPVAVEANPNDEIDYDDDDRHHDPDDQPGSPHESQSSETIGGTGKRSRPEGLMNEPEGPRNNETKRIRS